MEEADLGAPHRRWGVNLLGVHPNPHLPLAQPLPCRPLPASHTPRQGQPPGRCGDWVQTRAPSRVLRPSTFDHRVKLPPIITASLTDASHSCLHVGPEKLRDARPLRSLVEMPSPPPHSALAWGSDQVGVRIGTPRQPVRPQLLRPPAGVSTGPQPVRAPASSE